MNAPLLPYNPTIYRLLENWDILTVDGHNPNESFYTFLRKTEFASDRDMPLEVWRALRAGQWSIYALEESGLTLQDFQITPAIFILAGEAYTQIYADLSLALEPPASQPVTTVTRAARWVAKATTLLRASLSN